MNDDKQKQIKAEQTGRNNAQVAANDAATYFASHKNNRLNNDLNNVQNNISKRNIDGIDGSSYLGNNSPYNQIKNSRNRPNSNFNDNVSPSRRGPKKRLPNDKAPFASPNKKLTNSNPKVVTPNRLATNDDADENIASSNGVSDASSNNLENNQNDNENVAASNLTQKRGLLRKSGLVPKKEISKRIIKKQAEEADDVEHDTNKAVATGKKVKETVETIVKIRRTLIVAGLLAIAILIIIFLIIFLTSSGGVVATLEDDCYGGDDTGWWWPIGGETDSGGGIYDGEPVYRDTNPSDYGPRDPRIGSSSFHSGVDISVNGVGDPVIATKSGVVYAAEFSNSRHNHSCYNGVNKLCNKGISDCYGYGNYVMIDHGDGTISLYGHLSEVEVADGEHVEQGQLIGKTGSTGMSTGPHLHFEIRINGATKDPLNYISIDDPRPGKKTCEENYFCEGTNGDLISFLANWEGNEGFCTIDGQTGYLAKNLGDGATTVGPGFTNFAMTSDVVNYIYSKGYSKYYPGNTVSPGMCVPISVFNDVQLYAIETSYAKSVETAAQKYGVSLTPFQKDALTDFNYNQGTGYINELMSAYASGGYEGLWNAMSRHTKGGMAGIKKRLKGEFALFVTGDYSDQGKFYDRTIGNFYDYDSEGVMSREMVCVGDIDTKNYTKETSSGLNDVLTKTIAEALKDHHTTYKQFNESILNSVIKAGVGTRDGVVAAAVSLVAGLYENYQIRLPYTYGGQHGYALNSAANPLGSSFYGVDPSWGKYIGNFYLSGYGPYHYYGPDCSGFVMWALHNGGMKAYPGTSTNYPSLGRNITLNGKRVGDPGDLMGHPGHIMLIVGVDDAKKVYYVAHASGGSEGVKISTIGFSNSYNYVVKMDNFYANASNREYTNSSSFTNAFRAGEL